MTEATLMLYHFKLYSYEFFKPANQLDCCNSGFVSSRVRTVIDHSVRRLPVTSHILFTKKHSIVPNVTSVSVSQKI